MPAETMAGEPGYRWKHPVQKHWRATQERVEKFISDTYFTDVNLMGRLYPITAPLSGLKWFKASGRVPFQEAAAALEQCLDVLGSNVSIGPTWSTHWFLCTMEVPAVWVNRHVVFRWDSQCEAMVWMNGKPLQGLTGGSRTNFTLTKNSQGGESFVLYVEVAANGLFGAGHGGMINPSDPDVYYRLVQSDVAVFDEEVYELLVDLTLLIDMAKNLPRDLQRAHEALYTANDVVNACDPFDKSSFSKCRSIAKAFFDEKNGDSQHTIYASGHCHIDTAWLWPYAETIRKCARSWSSTVRLMEEYPSFKFSCSQAQQFEWVKVHYPSLYQEIKEKVARGQFIPVGGAWIEMDGNIPSGESFVRQFVIGQRFFKQEFGFYCKEFWLPDTFGYSAQLPQIMNGVGISRFLTQKLSWNLTNTFPHNTFIWEGIDGSSCLAHFPPADTYTSDGSVKDVLKTVKNFREKGRSRQSMLLFGHGDGGGGPTRNMLEMLKRMEDVDGLPKVRFSEPSEFFSAVEDQDAKKLCKWRGELYLELHRGTYTTQAKIKQENRRGEFLFHDLDFVSAVNLALSGDVAAAAEAKSSLLPLWKSFLTNQFHDVLPGSCIELVTKDALEIYSDVKQKASNLMHVELQNMLKRMWDNQSCSQEKLAVVNTFCWERKAVMKLPLGCVAQKPSLTQVLHDGSTAAFVHCVPMGVQGLEECAPVKPVSIYQGESSVFMENLNIKAEISNTGLLRSLIHKKSGRDAVGLGAVGNQFVLFDDVPLFWDAWDVMEYHLETRKPVEVCTSFSVVDQGPLRASVKVNLRVSEASHIEQLIILDADSSYLHFETAVEWHEAHKFLKVEFPVDIRSMKAKYDIQFGHLERPTHFNTSWDQAKFEVCGHKWADLSEHGFGVSLLSDCKYGYSTLDNVMRISLLRSPKAPDEHADMGPHSFAYAILPHQGELMESGVIQEGYNFNHPLTAVLSVSEGEKQSFFTLSNQSVVLETVKMCEEDTASVVLRFYEAFGGHACTTVHTTLPVKSLHRCNLLEEVSETPPPPIDFDPNTKEFSLHFKPFEIITVKMCCAL